MEEMTAIDLFDRYKGVELEVIDTQIVISKRADAFMDVKRQAENYFSEKPTKYDVFKYMNKITNTYESIKEIVGKIEYEDFCIEEISDPFEELIVQLDESMDDEEIFMAYLALLAVRPFAERIFRMHQCVMDDLMKEKLDGVEEED